MKTRLVAIAVVGLLAQLVAASAARAQLPGMGGMPQRHLVRVGLGGGVSVPTSNTADALKNGINGQGYLLLDPGLGFPLRLNLGFQKFDWQEALLGGGNTSGESQMLSGLAGLNVNLFNLGPLHPYVTAGLGAFRLKDTSGGTSASSTKFGIDGGGGLAVRLGRLEAFLEGRLQNVYTDQGAIDTKSIRAIPVTFGLIY